MADLFKLTTHYQPAGDQPQAINELVDGLKDGLRSQVLLGVTGSGKTFTIANVVQSVQRPTIVLAPNKTLAAQLYGEFRELFSDNAVEYFVSYYDYYQPEAYIPSSDIYIEKDASINDHIEQMRLSATKSLLQRQDVLVVASVSAIYGLGDPESYMSMLLHLSCGEQIEARKIMRVLVDMQYNRNDVGFERGSYRVRGDVIDIFPADAEKLAVRVGLFDDVVETLQLFDPLTGEIISSPPRITVFPKSHYVTPQEILLQAITGIEQELHQRLAELKKNDRLVELQRLDQRTRYDLEMMRELGYCQGIENYSRHLSKRKPGEPPPTLFDYLPDNALVVIDESHVTIPQLGGMYRGDRSRKETLVEHGFRLPSALDNRPLQFEEWEKLAPQLVFVSATPGPYELQHADTVVEQLVRPTGLVDPELLVRPANTQVDDLLSEINSQVATHERVLVTVLTKRMAEDLTEYLADHGVRVRYLHSDIDTVERMEIIRDLRLGEFDVLVGINLLREGLDLPEVALVAILDADREGFLRSERSLIQTIGRAARNLKGRVIMYADNITHSMQRAIDETERRRSKQAGFNRTHNITPKGIHKDIPDIMQVGTRRGKKAAKHNRSQYIADSETSFAIADIDTPAKLAKQIRKLEEQMKRHASELEFEQAADIRDQILQLKRHLLAGNVG